MREQAKKWLAEQLEENRISAECLADVLGIPAKRLCVGSGEMMEADDLLRICAFLCIRPESIPMQSFESPS